MTSKDPTAPGFKQKAAHELKDFAWISLYLAFFFCALSTYAMLLLRKYEINYLNYTFAIINALIIAKIILIGEWARLGRKVEARALYQAVLYKSVVFGLLVFGFHFVEEFVKRLIHGLPAGTVVHDIHFDDLIGRSIVIFCAFIPLFAFRELGRVMGEDKLHALFFKSGAADTPSASGRAAEI
jgi:p-aminobenzoyl-glutamate transporter AbgT